MKASEKRLAYKLLLKRQDGTYGPILCGRKERYTLNKWYKAATDHKPPAKIKYNPGFHGMPCPPKHLTYENRVLAIVELKGVDIVSHPGYDEFYRAKRMRIIQIITK